jgi:hypothetical protein
MKGRDMAANKLIFWNRCIILLLFCVVASLAPSCTSKKNPANEGFVLSGPSLGQSALGDTPQLFTPGFINTTLYTRDLTMRPDGNEIYFCISALGYNLIYYTKQEHNVWQTPEPASFITDINRMYYEPHIIADGKRLLFLSGKAAEGQTPNKDIWAVDSVGDGWGEAYNLGAPVNSAERFLIVPAVGMKDSYGGTDYYIVFRNEKDEWSTPINLGTKVNMQAFTSIRRRFHLMVDIYFLCPQKKKVWIFPVQNVLFIKAFKMPCLV